MRATLLPPIALLMLVGCATSQQQPLLVSEPTQLPTQQIPVVSGPCVAEEDVENIPASAMPPRSASIDRLANGAAADAIAYKKLAERQNKMLRACAKMESKK